MNDIELMTTSDDYQPRCADGVHAAKLTVEHDALLTRFWRHTTYRAERSAARRSRANWEATLRRLAAVQVKEAKEIAA